MGDWLRPLVMVFYDPLRGMAEARDRVPLAQAAFLALLAQSGYALYTEWLVLSEALGDGRVFALFSVALRSAASLFFLALIFVPAMLFVANLLNHRASFGLAMRQEYAPFASTVFYSWAAANIGSLPLAFFAKSGGMYETMMGQMVAQWQQSMPPDAPQLDYVRFISNLFFRLLMLPLFGLWTSVAVREVFRLSWARAIVLGFTGTGLVYIGEPLFITILGPVLGSPFLALLLFLLLRGYISEVMRNQRARAAFKRSLEIATLNPADASAHYNLGLIHLQRNELDAARERFTRAVGIDPEEVDAHYQLGRISRMQNRLPDAIKHFEQVVVRAPAHAQHEIWREIGATYLAAGQFADARDALERFLAHRESDPEGLYLMGRALAGLGQKRAAAESMRACIEAVRTAPAYKYRAEKRWLNEAQQFLRSQS
jgi:tetratricopeptide (TPR) repeat protein